MVAITTPLQAVQAPQIEEQMEIVYVPNFTSKEGVESYIRYKFGASGDIAVKVANCESGLNPNALNNNPKTRDYSVSIFQINLFGSLAKSRPSKEWLMNPQNNIDYSHAMFIKEGWRPWTCHKKVTSTPSEKPLATLSY